MPICEAADKVLKTFQEEFMPVETFSEFLDVAGQCQGSVSQRSSAAKLVCLSGTGHSLYLHMSASTGENSPVGHQKTWEH